MNDYSIRPLTQTLAEVAREFSEGIIIKATDSEGMLIGSVRGRADGGACFVAKLFVHPSHRRRGLGTQLMKAIENACPCVRYELFTSARSLNNIRLYEKLGYARYKEMKNTTGLTMVCLEKLRRSED